MDSEKTETARNQLDFYDIVINIDSLLSLKEGWEVLCSETGYNNYMKQKEMRSCNAGVLGNGNKGKSFILQKLSDSKLLSGYSVKTEGLSLLYPKNIKRNIICLDTAGQETPLKDFDRDVNFKGKKEEEKLEMISNLARDRQMTELFLQSFVIQNSNILILVVGQLCRSDQKLLSRIKKECKNRNKILFVVHNLNTLTTKKEIEDYIDETLKKSLTFKLVETNFINLGGKKINPKEQNTKYFTEEEFLADKKIGVIDDNNENDSAAVVHLIIALEGSEAGNYYNQPVYDFLKEQLAAQSNLKPFPVVDKVAEHLFAMSKEMLEEPIDNIQDIESNDKLIKITNDKNIQLKKCLIDEIGKTQFIGKAFIPKYSYDIDADKKKFIVSLELSGKIEGVKCFTRIIGEEHLIKISGNKVLDDKGKNKGTCTMEYGSFIIEFRVNVSVFQFKSTIITKKEKKNGVYKLYFDIQDVIKKD